MSSNFIINDPTSEFAKYLPEKWIEPLTIISRIKGYSGIYEYVLELIRSRLEMFVDTKDDLDEYFQDYMKNVEGIDKVAEEEKYVEVPIDTDVYKRFEKYVEKKQQKQDQDTNESEEEESK